MRGFGLSNAIVIGWLNKFPKGELSGPVVKKTLADEFTAVDRSGFLEWLRTVSPECDETDYDSIAQALNKIRPSSFGR